MWLLKKEAEMISDFEAEAAAATKSVSMGMMTRGETGSEARSLGAHQSLARGRNEFAE